MATFAASTNEHVILLHGLSRTSQSMSRLEQALTSEGYPVWNVNYPSRQRSIEELAEAHLAPAIAHCQEKGAKAIHFVTHSMGALIVRQYLAQHKLTNTGRIVLLGPPNQGSELADKFDSLWLYQKFLGPAGGELGTSPTDLPQQLGTLPPGTGVIAGSRSLNWFCSALLPGPDDGKVSVARTKCAGMADHLVIPTAHPFLPRNRTAIRQSVHFIQTGSFLRPDPS